MTILNCQDGLTTSDILDAVNENTVKWILAKPVITAIYSPFGNSITAAVNGFWQWFYTSQGGSIVFLSNEGVGGDTTQAMIDRIDDIPSETTLSTVMEATNDSGQGVTALQHANNIKFILEDLIDKGINPIMLLSPPKDNTVETALIRDMNLYDWVTARNLGVLCLNPFDQFSDGFGFYKVGTSNDGVHPSSASQKQAGITLSEQFDSYVSVYPFNTNNNTGEIANPLFMVDANANNIPDSWNMVGGSDFLLSETSLGLGNTFKFKANGGLVYAYQLFSLQMDKKYSFACKLDVDFISRVDGKVEVYLQDPSGTRTYLMDEGYQSTGESILIREFTTNQEVGDWRVYFTANGTDYEVDISIAQVTIFCLDDYTI